MKTKISFKSTLSAAGLLLCAATVASAQERLDLTTPEGAVAANRKIQCSLVDEKPIFYWWKGGAYSRRMGEPDVHLFNVEGMNVRTCGTIDDPKRGKGARLVSREILLYTDKKTGEPMEKWDNPFTDQTVDVVHVLNDPVNQRPFFPYKEDGTPASRWYGTESEGRWWTTVTIPLFYHNPLQGNYQKQVGGAYHAVEMFNTMGDLDSLTDLSKDTAKAQVGWVRMSDWLPWMEMQGREGVIYFHTAGHKVSGYDAMGEVMKKYIEEKAPLYKNPPSVSDDRPNETSWIVYGNTIEGETLPRGGAN